MAPENRKSKVRRVIDEAYNKGNFNALDEIIAPDSVSHQPPGPDIKGLDAYKQRAADMRKTFSGFHFTVDELIREGDMFAARCTLRGTHTGQWLGIPPTGKPVTITALLMSRWVNDKIAEQWVYMDTLGLMQQLGVAPPMGQSNK